MIRILETIAVKEQLKELKMFGLKKGKTWEM